jgi:hypothetical protein
MDPAKFRGVRKLISTSQSKCSVQGHNTQLNTGFELAQTILVRRKHVRILIQSQTSNPEITWAQFGSGLVSEFLAE